MKRMTGLITLVAVIGLWAATATALEPGDTRVTTDTAVALIDGSTGVRALDFDGDGDTTVKLWRLGAAHAVIDTAFVYLRDGKPRHISAQFLGWSSIDSMAIDLGDATTETIYTPIR